MQNIEQSGVSSSTTVQYSRWRSSRGLAGTNGSRSHMNDETRSMAPTLSRGQILNSLIQMLDQRGIYGPVSTWGREVYIGQGAQFLVTKQFMDRPWRTKRSYIEIAVKQPKFKLGHDEPLSLGHVQSEKHLRDLHTEFNALSTAALRRHPNIVQIISWAFPPVGIHSPISLIMELAQWTLSQYLQDANEDSSFDERNDFCTDIAAGLDMIHENGFIHGDLKPDNILIFQQSRRRVAKIADFGYCIADPLESGGAGVYMGGTEGWQAPEVEQRSRLVYADMVKADNYSFGLLVWSIVTGDGNRVPAFVRRNDLRMIKEQLKHQHIEDHFVVSLCSAFCSLLHHEPRSRAEHLRDYFPSQQSLEDYDEVQGLDYASTVLYSYVMQETGSIQRPFLSYRAMVEATLPVFSWEPEGLLSQFLEGLYESGSNLLAETDSTVLFGGFLLSTASIGHNLDPKTQLLSLLLDAASERPGIEASLAARAVLPNVLDYFGKRPSPIVVANMKNWIIDAISDGSTWAKYNLEGWDPAALTLAMEKFQQSGGYNSRYSPGVSQMTNFHTLAAYGSLDEVRAFLSTATDFDINEVTEWQETPLYLACLRGSWDVVALLIEHGAAFRGREVGFGVTCLHWLFCFPEENQESFVVKYLASGGYLDERSSHPIPFPHYPFLLPAGTALHWAVVTSSHSAIKILLQHRASVAIRDLSDPYIFDDRIRSLNQMGGPYEDLYSCSDTPTMGLSPLDYAAIEQDPFVFELVASLGIKVDINSVDEEGLSILHRLSANRIRRTRRGTKFSFLPFQGIYDYQAQRVSRIISIVKSLGGDLNLLTTPNIRLSQPYESPEHGHQLTPLMMAVRGDSLGPNELVVNALLDEGADPNIENDQGETALHQMQPCLDYHETEITMEILNASGADLNHRRRDGVTPLLVAARIKHFKAFDVLSCRGADIMEKEKDEKQMLFGSNILIVALDNGFPGDQDLVVSIWLKGQIFSHPDKTNRERLVHEGDLDGRTLLHLFAQQAMPLCTQLLALHGANTNALMWHYDERFTGDSVSGLDMRQITPLDAAQIYKKVFIARQENSTSRRVTAIKMEQTCAKFDQVTEILTTYSGTSGPTKTISRSTSLPDEYANKIWPIRWRKVRDLCLREQGLDIDE